jgi:tetratricopeptide (TPR) repeat protein
MLAVAGMLPLLACARPSAPTLPAGHTYIFPSWPPGELGRETSQQIQKAWREILTGKVRSAEGRLVRLLKQHPGCPPVETALAYARLRAGRLLEARAGFEGVLSEHPDYFPALVGGGEAIARGGDPDRALDLLKRAVAVEPREPRVQRRLSEIKLRVTERSVAAARTAQAEGNLELAEREYRRALSAAPELGALRVELADLLVAQGDPAGAMALLEEDTTHDRLVMLRLGRLLSQQGEHAQALATFRELLARHPGDAEVAARAEEARRAFELSQMPEAYRRIPGAARINRADLAALLSAKITALRRLTGGEPAVAVDISGSWARVQIIQVLALGVMDVYPNHTFQPGATVRRGDVASAVARVLSRLGKRPTSPAPAITDMSRHNLLYNAASQAVAAGLLDLTPGGAFEAWRPVSGQSAIEIIEALARLVGP